MNDENPFQPPGAAHVAASETTPRRSKAAIIGLFFLMLITYVINGPLANFLLGLFGIPAMDIIVLFGREVLIVYVIISSLALFKCSIKTHAITSAIVIAALFVRAYIECLDYGSMDGLLNFWIYSSAVAMAAPYLYVAESFLVRRMRSSASP